MKLETRTYVLQKALVLENSVNQLVKLFLYVGVEKEKAITHKSGGFSFKNKIDLLYDIEVLEENEYKAMLLLMEYRNQFMHNYHCNTFLDTFDIFENDKKNKLLSFLKKKPDSITEELCVESFNELDYYINKTILKKLAEKRQSLKDNQEFLSEMCNKTLMVYEKYFDIIDFVYDFIENDLNCSDDALKIKNKLMVNLSEKVKSDLKNNNFKMMNINIVQDFNIRRFENLVQSRQK